MELSPKHSIAFRLIRGIRVPFPFPAFIRVHLCPSVVEFPLPVALVCRWLTAGICYKSFSDEIGVASKFFEVLRRPLDYRRLAF
jgi:hypothetical protein